MGGSAHPSFAMAALLIAGGGAGYARAKSLPSLVAGITFSGAFLLSGWWIQNGQDYKGHRLALSASSLLSGAMLARVVKSRKPIPASIAAVGLLSAAYHGKKTMDWAPEYVANLSDEEDKNAHNNLVDYRQIRADAVMADIDILKNASQSQKN